MWYKSMTKSYLKLYLRLYKKSSVVLHNSRYCMSAILLKMYFIMEAFLATFANFSEFLENPLYKEWSFMLRISSVNADLVTFTKEIYNGKLHFLCNDVRCEKICSRKLSFFSVLFMYNMLYLTNCTLYIASHNLIMYFLSWNLLKSTLKGSEVA